LRWRGPIEQARAAEAGRARAAAEEAAAAAAVKAAAEAERAKVAAEAAATAAAVKAAAEAAEAVKRQQLGPADGDLVPMGSSPCGGG